MNCPLCHEPMFPNVMYITRFHCYGDRCPITWITVEYEPSITTRQQEDRLIEEFTRK